MKSFVKKLKFGKNKVFKFSFFATICIGALNLYTMILLVKCSDFICHNYDVAFLDYGHLAKKAVDFGPIKSWRKHSRKGLYIVNGLLLGLSLGSGSAGQVFLADNSLKVRGKRRGGGKEIQRFQRVQ